MARKKAPSKDSEDRAKFEQLWQAADKLRGHMDAEEYKHVEDVA